MSANTTNAELESTVWILVGLTGSTVGILSLEGGRLVCTAFGRGALSARHCRKLGRLCRQADLDRRLDGEEGVRLLDEALDALRFAFPGCAPASIPRTTRLAASRILGRLPPRGLTGEDSRHAGGLASG